VALSAPTNPDATSIDFENINITWTDGDTYDLVYIAHNVTGVWHETITPVSGGVEEHLQNVGGEFVEDEWSFKMRGWATVDGFSDYSDVVSATCHSGTNSGTVSLSANTSGATAYAQTITGTVSSSGNISQTTAYAQTITGTVEVNGPASPGAISGGGTKGGGSKTLKTDYRYFLGTANGKTHLHSDEYAGDAGVVIPCQYETKDTDFADQDQKSNDQWKTVYSIKLFYEDMSADTDIVVAISTDGGATFPTSQTRTLGDGSETRKDATYYFIVTGQFFRFRVSSGSASTTFKILGMEVEYEDAGPHWDTA